MIYDMIYDISHPFISYHTTWVRVVLGTSCLGYELSWERVVLGMSCPGYELSWVRVVLGTSCPGYELSRSPSSDVMDALLRIPKSLASIYSTSTFPSLFLAPPSSELTLLSSH